MNDIDPVFASVFGEGALQRITKADIWGDDVVQDEVGVGEHVGQRLVFPALHILGNRFALGDRAGAGFQVLDDGGEKAAGATGRVEHGFAVDGVDHLGH
jgi:hypothetical protein